MGILTKEKSENKIIYSKPSPHTHSEYMIDKSVCVIVLIYNGQEYIKDCFSSLLKIDYPTNNFKILTVDNNSNDNSISLIEQNFPKVSIIRNKKNYGFAKGNNIGIKWAIEKGFDYIYLLNHDTVVNKNFLVRAVSLAESDEKIGAVQSRIMLYNNKNLINTVGNEVYYLGLGFCGGYKEVYQKNKSYLQEISYPSGAGMLIKTALLKKIGFFDEDFFMYTEDLDLGVRILLAGYKNVLAESSIVYHKYNFSRNTKKFYYMERNRYLFLFKNFKIASLILISPALIFMEIGMIIFSLFSGWWRDKFLVYSYFFELNNWNKIIKKRKKIRQIRKIYDKNLFEKFVGKIFFQEPPMNQWIWTRVFGPLFNFYFILIKKIVVW